MAKPTTPAKWYRIEASGAGPDVPATVYIYGDIGESWFGESITAAQFVRDLDALASQNVTFRINSFGGSVTDGLAIYNSIKRRTGTKSVAIDGLAASIASLIAMAGDTVEIAANAQLMLHAPWGGVRGNANDMREYADMLDSWAQAMAANYVAKSGQKLEDVLALLTDGKDHWFSAQEAVDAGYADKITDAVDPAASALDLSRYESLPAAAAAFNLRNSTMTPEQLAAQEAANRAAAAAAASATNNQSGVQGAPSQAAVAEAAETVRKHEIIQLFSRFSGREGVDTLRDQCLAKAGMSVDEARISLLAKLGEGAEPANAGFVVTVKDSIDKMSDGVRASLEHRAGLAKDDTANQFRGYTLLEMARAFLAARGVRDFGNKLQVVASAFTHSSGDFPKILENIANKSMLKGYEEAGDTFRRWTSKGVLSDFKIAKRVDLGLFPSLAAVPEGGEYSYATIGERNVSVVLGTYGKMFSITRQAIINDDVSAFTKIPGRMGRAALRTVENLAYAALLDNPTFDDGTALFHANHGNLLGSGTAISTDSVDAMRVAMATQSDADGVATGKLGVELAYLLVPKAKEGRANVVRTSEFHYGASAVDNTIPNAVRNTFEVIADARLDTSSSTAWYGLADPNRYDGVEVSYLDGVETPFMESKDGWDVDGVEFKVRIDASAKCLDPKTVRKNPGA